MTDYIGKVLGWGMGIAFFAVVPAVIAVSCAQKYAQRHDDLGVCEVSAEWNVCDTNRDGIPDGIHRFVQTDTTKEGGAIGYQVVFAAPGYEQDFPETDHLYELTEEMRQDAKAFIDHSRSLRKPFQDIADTIKEDK